jgi:hypothetical protein
VLFTKWIPRSELITLTLLMPLPLVTVHWTELGIVQLLVQAACAIAGIATIAGADITQINRPVKIEDLVFILLLL